MEARALDLKGKIALVTGASRGIGRALSLELCLAGAHIIAVARKQDALEDLDDAIRKVGGSATLVPMDLRDMEALDTLAHKIEARWGVLDILVANAGILGQLSPFEHIDTQVFTEVLQINLFSQWYLMRNVASLLYKAAQPRVVVLSSGVAHSARAFWGAYAASKAGLETLVRCWAHERENHPIRINLVNPGATRTGMRAAAMPGEDPMTLPSPEEVARTLLPLFSATLTQTGKLFDARKKRFTSYHLPD